jgi:uncharacterized membrane protein
MARHCQLERVADTVHPHPWYDITCGACVSVIATVQIVPDDKPLQPSKAVEQKAAARDVIGQSGLT